MNSLDKINNLTKFQSTCLSNSSTFKKNTVFKKTLESSQHQHRASCPRQLQTIPLSTSILIHCIQSQRWIMENMIYLFISNHTTCNIYY